MRPSGAWLAGWSRKGIRAQQLDAFKQRMALRTRRRPDLRWGSTEEAQLERALGIVNTRFAMQLSPATLQPEPQGQFRTPKQLFHHGAGGPPDLGVRCRGWWYLPLDGSTRSNLRTFAHFYARTRVEEQHVNAMSEAVLDPETRAPLAVAVLLSVRGFRPAGLHAAMSSSTPFLLIHLPDPMSPESCLEAARVGTVGRSVKEDSALDLDFAVGSCICNKMLRGLLGDRMKTSWIRDESLGTGWAVGVPELIWDGKILSPYDDPSGPNLAERLAARQTEEAEQKPIKKRTDNSNSKRD